MKDYYTLELLELLLVYVNSKQEREFLELLFCQREHLHKIMDTEQEKTILKSFQNIVENAIHEIELDLFKLNYAIKGIAKDMEKLESGE